MIPTKKNKKNVSSVSKTKKKRNTMFFGIRLAIWLKCHESFHIIRRDPCFHRSLARTKFYLYLVLVWCGKQDLKSSQGGNNIESCIISINIITEKDNFISPWSIQNHPGRGHGGGQNQGNRIWDCCWDIALLRLNQSHKQVICSAEHIHLQNTNNPT